MFEGEATANAPTNYELHKGKLQMHVALRVRSRPDMKPAALQTLCLVARSERSRRSVSKKRNEREASVRLRNALRKAGGRNGTWRRCAAAPATRKTASDSVAVAVVGPARSGHSAT